ncbi:MAG TPA: shikimate dehydrogenase [Fervidobacterium sp.]|nr:shikimate dehydrogenase [Fervidobacterium sp.]
MARIEVDGLKKFGLLQYPEKMSLSNRVFNLYFAKAGIDATYEDIVLTPQQFDEEVDNYIASYDGLNVTVPFKGQILRHVTPVEDASKCHAVNCIFQRKGYNTDWLGFYNSLASINVEGPLLLLGAGGVSRAILYALCKMGHKEIHLCNRTVEKALQVKEDFSKECEIIVESFGDLKDVLKGVRTFINATSIGMFGELFDLNVDDISHLSLVYDVVYNYTPLQEMAKEVGITCVDGKAFWYHQAVENLKIWDVYEEKIFTECFEQIVGAES